uniref:Pentatricopeptide repeat-containing protein At1g03100, mitochondrial n=1 Tax=Anthurium amnicola TaxID=1678845 RepID=A0A1D1ZEY5_9ARAE
MERVLVNGKALCRSTPYSASILVSSLVGSYCNVSGAITCNDSSNLGSMPIRWFTMFSCNGRPASSGGNAKTTPCEPPLFSPMAESVLVWARDPGQVAMEITNAADEKRLDEAWKLYERYVHMDGFPRKSVLSKLICCLAESCDHQWLIQAFSLVEQIFEEKKQELLEKHVLLYLSFILARCKLPVLASTILRKLVEVGEFPPIAAWTCVIANMSQTSPGAFLAAELVGEIGYTFKDNRVDSRKKCNRQLISMKPDPMAFNIALTGCLAFGIIRKAEHLLELMPRVGVKADANLLIVMAHIFERNGRLDEIKKLKRHIDESCSLSDLQFQQFYNCLLSCHLKFRDMTSACDVVLDMLRKAKKAKSSLTAANSILEVVQSGKASTAFQDSEAKGLDTTENFNLTESQPPCYVDFIQDKKFSRLSAEVKVLLRVLSEKLQVQVELVKLEHGILHPSEKIYAKLVKAFLEADKVSELAAFLIKANSEVYPASSENSIVVQVINACIGLGLLEQAHDILDEMRFHGIRVGSSVYSSLLKSYCKESRLGEINALLKDAQKAGIQLDSSCYEYLIQARVHQKDISGALHLFKEMKDSNISRSSQQEFDMLVEGCTRDGKASLMTRLLQEIKDDQGLDCGVHDWNNVIHFFCKKKLMQDAQKALKKMRALGHSPNAQTFHSLVTGYAAIGGKYVEITDLWGEMKVLASSNSIKFDQELLDSLLYCFVRGGFFLRACEIVEMMEREHMFIDKYKYRSLWLKYHRSLYKGKAPKIQTEAQCKRREAALYFKRWLGFT